MRRPYRLARPVPSTACLSASLIHCAKMNHRIPVGPRPKSSSTEERAPASRSYAVRRPSRRSENKFALCRTSGPVRASRTPIPTDASSVSFITVHIEMCRRHGAAGRLGTCRHDAAPTGAKHRARRVSSAGTPRRAFTRSACCPTARPRGGRKDPTHRGAPVRRRANVESGRGGDRGASWRACLSPRRRTARVCDGMRSTFRAAESSPRG